MGQAHLNLASVSAILVLGIAPVSAQLDMNAVNTPFAIDFEGTVPGVSNGVFDGSGFTPAPGPGQLDSDAWNSFGWSDGLLTFGGTQVSGDFARGVTTVPVAVGGIYAMSGAGLNGTALGVQPNSTDFAPGWITLKANNTSGVAMTWYEVSYDVFYRNDEGRSSSLVMEYRVGSDPWVPIPATTVTSPAAATGTAWVQNTVSTVISGIVIPDGDDLRIRWRGEDVGGSGARDEFAIDDISLIGRDYTVVRFTSPASSVLEDAGSTSFDVEIINPSTTLATTVDVVLLSGDAARIDNYTTQNLVFPAGSSTPVTVPITVTDNAICDGDALLTFDLQNVAGGVGTPLPAAPVQHLLTVDDNESSAGLVNQGFDGLPADNWPLLSGAGSINSNTGATFVPAFQHILSGANSIQVSGSSAVLELGTVDLEGWSNITIQARISATATNASAGADGNDRVQFFVDVDGAGYPVTADLEVRGNSNARWGFSTGTGVASTTVGTPAVFFPAGGGDRTTDGYSFVEIDVPAGTSTLALRVTVDNDLLSERWNLEDIRVTGDVCGTIYYSRGNGSELDPVWSTSRTGAPGPAVFDPLATAVVQSGDVITTAGASWVVRSLRVEAGGSLDLGTTDVDLYGVQLANDGSLAVSTGTVSLLNSFTTLITGASVIELENLVLDGGGALLLNDSLRIRSSLDIINGTFDANNTVDPDRDLVFASDLNGTGRLGPLSAPGAVVGRITMQRYIPAGVTNWRLLSSSVSPVQLWQWRDDFFTAGFPGSHFPSFDQPVGSGILWPSIRSYDETDPGSSLNDGLVGPANISDPIVVGKGYAAWCGDNLVSTTEFVIDVRREPNIAVAPLALPMSWTDTGTPAVDGWNLVGNPLPSPIDFGALALGADVENEFWVFDPVAGNNVFWNETLGIGSSVMNGNVQSSQGFWLHAIGPANTVTVDEGAKTLDPNGGAPFGGLLLQNEPLLRFGMHSQLNQFSDETIFHFGAGVPANDGPDMEKFFFSHPEAPQMWSATSDGEALALNAWGDVTTAVSIPVHVKAGVSGDYTLEVMQMTQPMAGYCLELEDLSTGTMTEVVLGATYTFTLDAATPADPARFVLHVTVQPEGELTASATEVMVGEPIDFDSGTQPGTPVSWDFGDGSTSTDAAQTHSYGMPGTYPVTLTLGTAPCELVLNEVIEVGISTGLEELGDEAFSAWTEGDAIRLRWAFPTNGAYEVKVFDPRGREVKALRLAEASGQATLDLGGHPDGVYVLRLLGADLMHTVRLPLVR